ncbi:YifB family Mg chelatase-like AAA ATPase [Nonomuraea mangrovi]|uniref:YifB family Mg chelatase-like AAA ATPase n=1 Tax=Nonomuraea mangrovi TaxID=2316207 RepID=A0ABW4T077_9ACTN
MGYAAARSAVVDGVTGRPVTVTADVSPGLSSVTGCTPEQRDRIRAAIINSGYDWPDGRITLSAELYGSMTDLAVAVALLAADGQFPAELLANVTLLGELDLDGRLRPVCGILPAVSAAGNSVLIVLAGSAAEAAQVPGAVVIPVVRLAEVVSWLSDGALPVPGRPADVSPVPALPALDLADVPGNHAARFALEVCAAGGHHLFLAGNGPGVMLAERLPGILPPLDDSAALEVAAIYSMAGRYDLAPGRVPPMSAPHHTTTLAGVVGNLHRPGMLSLAHRGVLVLDDAPEFNRQILGALRGVLESGEVRVSGRDRLIRYPARIQLVLLAACCPCAGSCSCTPAVRRRYLERLARPMPYVEVRAQLERPARVVGRGEPSAVVAVRVSEARERAAARLAGTPWRTNAEVPAAELRTRFPDAPDAIALLDQAVCTGRITSATFPRLLRVAWTLADLRGAHQPSEEDAARTLGLWNGVCDAPR